MAEQNNTAQRVWLWPGAAPGPDADERGLERDEEKWIPVFRSSARSKYKNKITVHDFRLIQSKIIVI